MIFQERHTWQIRITSSAPVLLCLLLCMLKPPWHLPQPTLRELMSSKAWSSKWSSLPSVLSYPPRSLLPMHVRDRVAVRKGQTCSSPTNSAPIGDSALKVEYRIKGLIILALKWDSIWNLCQNNPRQRNVLFNYSLDSFTVRYSSLQAPHILSRINQTKPNWLCFISSLTL